MGRYKRVVLIPTGTMEQRALGPSLAQLFPGHCFESDLSFRGGEPFPSFTSTTLALNRAAIPTNLMWIVQRMAGLVDPENPSPADGVLVLDDLELANLAQPDVAVAYIRDAVELHLRQLETRPFKPRSRPEITELRNRLRERCSFHFAVPMIESWLFADPMGPMRAGVPSERARWFNPSNQGAHVDPEGFLTDDPDYLDDSSARYPLRKKVKNDKLPDWLNDDRSRHPKNYLRYLCRSDTEKGWTCYRETRGGAEALRLLDWATALKTDAWMPYARALIADLADALGEQPPALLPTGQEAPLTTFRGKQPSARVLRNL